MSTKSCPKCQGSMEVGLLPDLGDANHVFAGSWLAGEPEKRWWLGLKMKDKHRFRINAYRCTKCGYLESYATDPMS